MDANSEFRLALGERADKLGLILSQVGTMYQLAPQDPVKVAEPVFESADLAEVENYLTRIEQG